MSIIGCPCGKKLTYTDSPCECIVEIWDADIVNHTLESNNSLSAWDAYADVFTESGFEFWYCPDCERISVYQFDAQRVVKRYKRVDIPQSIEIDDTWHGYYFVTDVNIYHYFEKKNGYHAPLQTMVDYLTQCALSADKKQFCKKRKDGTWEIWYQLEQIYDGAWINVNN